MKLINIKSISAYFLFPIFSAYLVFYCFSALHPIFPLPLLAFVPLVMSLLFVSKFSQAIIVSLAYSLFSGLIVFRGFENYGFWAYLGGAFFFGTQYFLFAILTYRLHINFKKPVVLAFLASTLYIAIDYIYANIYLAPTGRFAGSLAYDTHFLQLARLTGHSGLTFVLIFANIVIASALINSRQFKSHIPALLAVFLIFIAVYFYGSHCLNNSPSAGKIEEFAIIQGGITKEQYDAMEISQSSWKFVINRYFDMTTEAKQMGYNNIFWPETAIRSYVGIKDTLTSFVNTSDINLIGGFPLLIGSTNVQYNSVLSLDNNANIIGRYDKNHLLPFTENEFLSGEKSEPIKTKFGALVTPICLEGLFPNHIRSMVNKGGEAIVIFTNDSGFGQNAISALVLKQIFLRAVENNRYVVRVAQSGISALIDNFGQIIAQSSLMSREIIPVEFKLINQASLYGKLGEWFLLSTVFLSLSILLYSQRF